LDDVIKFAVEREETAYQLYKNAAERTDSISARKVFTELAHEEAGHKQAFEKLDLQTAHEYKIVDRPDMKIADYLVDIPFRPDFTYAEILHFAMKTEENAYKLYREAADAMSDPGLKKMLQVLADVEKEHKRRIEELYDAHVLTEN
jgi:rubrerythrin